MFVIKVKNKTISLTGSPGMPSWPLSPRGPCKTTKNLHDTTTRLLSLSTEPWLIGVTNKVLF